MQQAVAVPHLRDDPPHQHRAPNPVEPAHVDDVDAAPAQCALAAVDGAYAEQREVLRIDESARRAPPNSPSRPGSPHSAAATIPCRLPDGEVAVRC